MVVNDTILGNPMLDIAQELEKEALWPTTDRHAVAATFLHIMQELFLVDVAVKDAQDFVASVVSIRLKLRVDAFESVLILPVVGLEI